MRTLFLILLPLVTFGQGPGLQFIDYDEVMRGLKQQGKSSDYYQTVDCESLILLDKSCTGDLLSVWPRMLKEKSIDTIQLARPVPEASIRRIRTGESSIRKFILSGTGVDRSSIRPPEVYVKDDKIAVFTSAGRGWYVKYRLTLMEGYVQEEVVYTEIE